jgi:hypothetical protein
MVQNMRIISNVSSENTIVIDQLRKTETRQQSESNKTRNLTLT